ncbi:hypothetical protein SB6421_03815 [Klebsiella huaxiensis]|nr:colanic acid biosynthesis pyruvyl transferase WcaK [Klebsiella huaxiensis]VUS83896.1 hypothetical protein SB6421_03815 [Klebsiella huaxiensis]
MPYILISHIENKGILKSIKLPEYIHDFVADLEQYDAVIQVGGSFFVDLYGVSQFEHILCSLLAKKKIFLIGHSVGPFEGKAFNEIAKYSFSHVNQVQLREEVSYELMKKYNFDMKNVTLSVDTAFLVDHLATTIDNYSFNYWQKIIVSKKTVAITVRKLAPFDKRLGVTQEQYEIAFANVIDSLICSGYQVVAFSTCTGIESYHNDDRIVALSIQKRVKNVSGFHVAMDEFNDLELGHLFKGCKMTIGTRLHSAIISMNFGTPALAFNYEHKSRGVMNELGMDFLSSDIDSLIDGSIVDKIRKIIEQSDDICNMLNQKVHSTRTKGTNNIISVLKEI